MDTVRHKVLITGGAMGIGASLARMLVEHGHSVVIADIADDAGQKLAKELDSADTPCFYVHADVSKSADVQNMVQRAVDLMGGLDWLVNNAGIALAKSVTETSEDEWHKLIGINLTGAWLVSKYAIPHLKGNKGAAIVNVASNAGLVGFSNLAAYCASKGGMIQLTKASALDLASEGIRVNAVAPGHTRTPMGDGFINQQADPKAFETEFINKSHPLGRMAEANEVAETIYFLLSEKASFVTGAVLSVDGGYVTR